MWGDVIQLIRQHHRFLVATHIHPDGDAIGALLGLGRFLRGLGKDILLLVDDPVPGTYRFLDPEGLVRSYEPERDDPQIPSCDAAILLDAGSLDRVGRVGQVFRQHRVPAVCIDHHVTNDGFADLNVIDPSAASTSSLVLALIRAMGQAPAPRVAQALFAGLATDTGWFRFANTTPQALRDAAELVERGADPAHLYARVYEELSWARLRLLGLAAQTLRSEADGRIAAFTVTRQMLEDTGAQDHELEGLVDNFRRIAGIELVVFFREAPDGRTRVSFRAKSDLDVSVLATALGGGGHRAAAGVTLDQPLDRAVPTVLAAARALVQAQEPTP